MGFLAQAWGLKVVLPDASFTELCQIDRALVVYNVFERSRQAGGLKKMSKRDKQLMASIMAMKEGDG